MKISTKGRYALHMMIDLAEHQGEAAGYVALKDIAKRQRISKISGADRADLEQVRFLHKTRSIKTPSYRLAKLPMDYTIKDILRIF